MKSRKESTEFSKVFSGRKKASASGILPLETAVACLPELLIASVKANAEESSSTLGLSFTAIKILSDSFNFAIICS